jgi:gliding motility-associated-like protein
MNVLLIFEDQTKRKDTSFYRNMRFTLLVFTCILSTLSLSGQGFYSRPNNSGILESTVPINPTDTVYVGEEADIHVYIPNIFSPNGDGTNDLFQIQAPVGYQVLITRFFIFDKRGTNVYSRYNMPVTPSEDWWDGSYKHFTMSPGVFAYYLEVQLSTGERKTYKGNVTLVR